MALRWSKDWVGVADFEALFSSEGIWADSDENAIKDAVAQMCAICDKVESAKAKGDKIRVVFFAVPSPHATDKVANCSAKTHKIMEDLLVDFLLNYFIITAFYAVLQNDKNCNGESKPYFAFGVGESCDFRAYDLYEFNTNCLRFTQKQLKTPSY